MDHKAFNNDKNIPETVLIDWLISKVHQKNCNSPQLLLGIFLSTYPFNHNSISDGHLNLTGTYTANIASEYVYVHFLTNTADITSVISILWKHKKNNLELPNLTTSFQYYKT